MDKLIEGLITSGIPAVVILFGLYLGKNLMEHFFNETIEIKKQQLEQESKNFQHQLDAKLQEFNIKFSSLHSERAIVIKELYLKMLILQSSINDILKINSKHVNNELLNSFSTSYTDLKRHYLPNKIYFSEKLTLKIDGLMNEYAKIAEEFTNILLENKKVNCHDDSNWSIIYKKSKSYSDEINNELIKDFREILGVKN